jgi:hypothetical protein
MDIITNQIEFLIITYPVIRYLFTWFIILRVLNKILFATIEKYVEITPEVKDNKIFKKVTQNKYYKLVSFILDLSLSVKLPKGK